jgi:uncharacterized protein YukE
VTFGSASSQLQHALKNLRSRFDAVEGGWRDDVRRHFVQTRLEPLDQAAEEAIRAMAELLELMRRVHRDCSDPDSL